MKIEIYVQPGASKSEVTGTFNNCLKVKIKSPPVDGQANDEVVRFFAQILKIAKSKITLIKGEKSRYKTLQISGVDDAEIQKLLDGSK